MLRCKNSAALVDVVVQFLRLGEEQRWKCGAEGERTVNREELEDYDEMNIEQANMEFDAFEGRTAKPVSRMEIHDIAMVHTPIHPSWSVQSARKIGKEVSSDE